MHFYVKIGKNFAKFQRKAQAAPSKNPKFEKNFYPFLDKDLQKSHEGEIHEFSHEMRKFIQ